MKELIPMNSALCSIPTEELLAEILSRNEAARERMARTDRMIAKYGEACRISTAAQILGFGRDRVVSMLADGRLIPACEGERVDVSSIAAYIESPNAAEHTAHIRRIKERKNTNWCV